MHYAEKSPVSLLTRSEIIGRFELAPDRNSMSILAGSFMENCKNTWKM
jgi:hypothetical protein